MAQQIKDPPPDPYLGYYAAAASKFGVPEALLVEQGRAESGFDPSVVSPAGAVGIAQLMPATAAGLGVNPRDPQQAINAQAQLMSGYLKQFGGDIGKALAAYNAGPGAVQQYGGIPPYAETQSYVRKIEAATIADLGGYSASGGVGGAVSGAASAVGDAVSGAWGLVTDPAGTIGNAVQSALSSALGAIFSALRPVLVEGVLVAGGVVLVVFGVHRGVSSADRTLGGG